MLDNQIIYNLQQQNARTQLENALKNNQHTLVVMSAEDYLDFYVVNFKRQNPGATNLNLLNHLEKVIRADKRSRLSIQQKI
ncbi:hypothetical protein [Aliikangiella maris]|uniref:Uncharacterized protein n=2 Tax=Aliikangiella maris TaxID=3162458 RepID=A0ABV3MU54_9GAMM